MRETMKKVTTALVVMAAAVVGLSLRAEAKAFDKSPVNRAASVRALPAGEAISEENYNSFDQGFAMVRALYFVSEEAEDGEFTEAAGYELYYLSEALAGTPEEEMLDEVIGMYLDGTGTREERWEAIEAIIASVSERGEGEPKWYFDAGVTLTKLSLFSYLEDEDSLQAELLNMEELVAEMPENVPAEMAGIMTEIAEYSDASDFETIGQATEDAMTVVLG